MGSQIWQRKEKFALEGPKEAGDAGHQSVRCGGPECQGPAGSRLNFTHQGTFQCIILTLSFFLN